PSMDIQAASNFERFLYFMLDQDPERVRQVMTRMKGGEAVTLPQVETSFRASRMEDSQIEQVIAQVWQDHHYVIDPHTACAFTDMAPDRVSIVLSTASPAKFPDVVQQATGTEPIHPVLEALKDKPLHTYPLDGSVDSVKAFIRSRI
ncbi:MAG TPA: threonine synthase, partial [Prosthecobacter sp.]|nr:threonine synthase [Prosthecobacter sp.]